MESKEAGREGLFSDIAQLIASGDPTLVRSVWVILFCFVLFLFKIG